MGIRSLIPYKGPASFESVNIFEPWVRIYQPHPEMLDICSSILPANDTEKLESIVGNLPWARNVPEVQFRKKLESGNVYTAIVPQEASWQICQEPAEAQFLNQFVGFFSGGSSPRSLQCLSICTCAPATAAWRAAATAQRIWSYGAVTKGDGNSSQEGSVEIAGNYPSSPWKSMVGRWFISFWEGLSFMANCQFQGGIVWGVIPYQDSSHHQDYYIFSRGSLQNLIYHCYWEVVTPKVLPMAGQTIAKVIFF